MLCALLVWSGCGSATGPAPTIDSTGEAPAPKPRDADEIARSIVGGTLGVYVFVDRLRQHPIGPQLAELGLWQEVFEGTGIDPLQDLQRTFVTAKSTRAGEPVVVVGEHELPRDRIRKALDVLIVRGDPPGSWLPEAPVPAARIHVRGERMVVALVADHVLVVIAEAKAAELDRFLGTGGLPAPAADEAVVATAVEPARNIHGAPFRIPSTIGFARGVVTPTDDGGADLYVEGQSTSEQQAKDDAEDLSGSLAEVTTVKIAVVKIKLFEPVEFRAEKKIVKGERHLTAAEIQRLLTLIGSNVNP